MGGLLYNPYANLFKRLIFLLPGQTVCIIYFLMQVVMQYLVQRTAVPSLFENCSIAYPHERISIRLS